MRNSNSRRPIAHSLPFNCFNIVHYSRDMQIRLSLLIKLPRTGRLAAVPVLEHGQSQIECPRRYWRMRKEPDIAGTTVRDMHLFVFAGT